MLRTGTAQMHFPIQPCQAAQLCFTVVWEPPGGRMVLWHTFAAYSLCDSLSSRDEEVMILQHWAWIHFSERLWDVCVSLVQGKLCLQLDANQLWYRKHLAVVKAEGTLGYWHTNVVLQPQEWRPLLFWQFRTQAMMFITIYLSGRKSHA